MTDERYREAIEILRQGAIHRAAASLAATDCPLPKLATAKRLAEALKDLLECHAEGGFVEPEKAVLDEGRASLAEFEKEEHRG